MLAQERRSREHGRTQRLTGGESEKSSRGTGFDSLMPHCGQAERLSVLLNTIFLCTAIDGHVFDKVVERRVYQAFEPHNRWNCSGPSIR